jgi:hypothetical protein
MGKVFPFGVCLLVGCGRGGRRSGPFVKLSTFAFNGKRKSEYSSLFAVRLEVDTSNSHLNNSDKLPKKLCRENNWKKMVESPLPRPAKKIPHSLL